MEQYEMDLPKCPPPAYPVDDQSDQECRQSLLPNAPSQMSQPAPPIQQPPPLYPVQQYPPGYPVQQYPPGYYSQYPPQYMPPQGGSLPMQGVPPQGVSPQGMPPNSQQPYYAAGVQGQQPVMVVVGGGPQTGTVYKISRLSFSGAMFLSCFVFCCCGLGWICGLAAFILAALGTCTQVGNSNDPNARRLLQTSYKLSIAGIVTGIICMIIAFGLYGLAASCPPRPFMGPCPYGSYGTFGCLICCPDPGKNCTFGYHLNENIEKEYKCPQCCSSFSVSHTCRYNNSTWFHDPKYIENVTWVSVG